MFRCQMTASEMQEAEPKKKKNSGVCLLLPRNVFPIFLTVPLKYITMSGWEMCLFEKSRNYYAQLFFVQAKLSLSLLSTLIYNLILFSRVIIVALSVILFLGSGCSKSSATSWVGFQCLLKSPHYSFDNWLRFIAKLFYSIIFKYFIFYLQ